MYPFTADEPSPLPGRGIAELYRHNDELMSRQARTKHARQQRLAKPVWIRQYAKLSFTRDQNKHCSMSTPAAPTTSVKSNHDPGSPCRHDSRLFGTFCSNLPGVSSGLLVLSLSAAS